jgi:hypothetical protein
MNGSQEIQVAVAVIRNDDQRLLWTFNRTWGRFCLPMTRCRWGRDGIEAPQRAAARAAAEALGVPVQVGQRLATLARNWVSQRDLTRKDYCYTVYEASWHPDYAGRLDVARPSLWLAAHEALSYTYDPLSAPSLDIVSRLIEQGDLVGRVVSTSVLIVRRPDPAGGPELLLLRANPTWGHTLPMKGHPSAPAADAAEAARVARATADEVARKELGLNPGPPEAGGNVQITPARPPSLTLSTRSSSTGEWTFYRHWLFDAVLVPPTEPVSPDPDQLLAWARRSDISAGMIRPGGADERITPALGRPVRHAEGVAGGPGDSPDRVSATVGPILNALGY